MPSYIWSVDAVNKNVSVQTFDDSNNWIGTDSIDVTVYGTKDAIDARAAVLAQAQVDAKAIRDSEIAVATAAEAVRNGIITNLLGSAPKAPVQL